jgi:hypothetical protein
MPLTTTVPMTATIVPLMTAVPLAAATPGASTPLSTTIPLTGTVPGTRPVPTGSAAAGTYVPVSRASCTAVRVAVSRVTGKQATTTTAPFQDPKSGATGTACQIAITGTGQDFPNYQTVLDRLKTVFQQLGWTENNAYQAGGPTGAATGFQLRNTLALVAVNWQPAPGACPTNQPISACQLTPAQQMYTITVTLAQPQ